MMNKKELLEKLIEAYSKAIREMPKKDWQQYLHDGYLSFGICNYAYNVLSWDLNYAEWLVKYIPDNQNVPKEYWDNVPGEAKTYAEAKRYLRTRLINLKNEWKLEGFHQPSKSKKSK